MTKDPTQNPKMSDPLRCPVCLEGYELDKHAPLQLHCGHAVCEECSERLPGRANHCKCPTCNDETSRRPLMRNYALCSIITREMRIRNKEVPCAYVATNTGTERQELVSSASSTDSTLTTTSTRQASCADGRECLSEDDSSSKSGELVGCPTHGGLPMIYTCTDPSCGGRFLPLCSRCCGTGRHATCPPSVLLRTATQERKTALRRHVLLLRETSSAASEGFHRQQQALDDQLSGKGED